VQYGNLIGKYRRELEKYLFFENIDKKRIPFSTHLDYYDHIDTGT